MSTGKVKSAAFLRDMPWHKRLVTVLKPLHFGDYAGLWVKLLYCIFGMLPGVLAISGFLIWRLRNRNASERIPRKRTALVNSSPGKPVI